MPMQGRAVPVRVRGQIHAARKQVAYFYLVCTPSIHGPCSTFEVVEDEAIDCLLCKRRMERWDFRLDPRVKSR